MTRELDPPSSAQASMFLDAARVSGDNNIFAFGPYGHRVNFASQQARALNTVWALAAHKVIYPNCEVAVVGGGLAGLTAAVALISHSCDVQLFESGISCLGSRPAAHHRLLHPTVTLWPFMGLSPTTHFPYLNWHVGTCTDVMSDLQNEWDTRFQEHLNEHLQTTVIDVKALSDLASGKRSVQVTYKPTNRTGNDKPDSQKFDLVVIATGFGTERGLESFDTPSYWKSDDLVEFAKEDDNKKFLVSGTGDGALIDSLRILYPKFENGKFALNLITKFSIHHGKTADLKKKEEEAYIYATAPLNENTVHAASLLLQEAYGQILRRLPDGIIRFLDDALSPDNAVTIFGKLPTPYSVTSAPIHKLILAHAIAKNRVTYCQKKADKGNVAGFHRHVARHGAVPPIRKLVKNLDIRKFKVTQLKLSDRLEMREVSHEDLGSVLKNTAILWPGSKEYQESQEKRILRFFSETFKMTGIQLGMRYEGKSLQATLTDVNLPKDLFEEFGGLGSRLFGVEFVVKQPQDAPLATLC